jgi:hypothetical protein
MGTSWICALLRKTGVYHQTRSLGFHTESGRGSSPRGCPAQSHSDRPHQGTRDLNLRRVVLGSPGGVSLFRAALSRCLAVIIRAIQTDLANRAGLTASSGARTGVVAPTQRFGSALNLNVPSHNLSRSIRQTLESPGQQIRLDPSFANFSIPQTSRPPESRIGVSRAAGRRGIPADEVFLQASSTLSPSAN